MAWAELVRRRSEYEGELQSLVSQYKDKHPDGSFTISYNGLPPGHSFQVERVELHIVERDESPGILDRPGESQNQTTTPSAAIGASAVSSASTSHALTARPPLPP